MNRSIHLHFADDCPKDVHDQILIEDDVKAAITYLTFWGISSQSYCNCTIWVSHDNFDDTLPVDKQYRISARYTDEDNITTFYMEGFFNTSSDRYIFNS